MSLSKAESLLPPEDHYIPFPSEHDQVYTVLPIHDPPTNRRSRRWPTISVLATLSLFLLGGFVYLFWPSDPTLQIVRLRLEKIRIHTVPIIYLDISMHVTIKVQNVDVYSIDLTNLDVAVKYRGKKLGHVQSDHGHVRAFGSSYVDAELNLSGVRVLADVVPLLDDLAKGSLPLDTVTEVSGRLGLLFFGFPLKAKLSCEVLVNTKNQTIVRQSCFPENKAFENSKIGHASRSSCFWGRISMELGGWCNSGSGDINSYVKNGYDRIMSFNKLAGTAASRTPRWRLLWRKLKKEKKKIFYCVSSSTDHRIHFSYDPYAYSQNFDQGSTWTDLDDMSRSFSARFAVPSRVFERS